MGNIACGPFKDRNKNIGSVMQLCWPMATPALNRSQTLSQGQTCAIYASYIWYRLGLLFHHYVPP